MDKYEITFQTWDKVALSYQDKFMDLDLYNDSYDLFCSLVKKPDPKIFEIGCGPGNITRYILSKRPDFKIRGIDVSQNMIKLAKENNPAAEFELMDCRKVDGLTSEFDAVICGFCMPYLSKEDCEKLIKDCSFLLIKGGILYFSTIEDDYHKSGYETNSSGEHQVYVYYHEAEYLKKYLEENAFEIKSVSRKSYQKTETVLSTHLIFVAKKI